MFEAFGKKQTIYFSSSCNRQNVMGTHCTAGMILFMCFPETKHILVKAPFHDSKNPLCKYLLVKCKKKPLGKAT